MKGDASVQCLPGRAIHIVCAALIVLLTSFAVRADETGLWDMTALDRFDPTNKAYDIVDGRVVVDLSDSESLCPTGLGHLASGRESVREIAVICEGDAAADRYLHVVWDPGGSGVEQFEVLWNGEHLGVSDAVDAAAPRHGDIETCVELPGSTEPAELVLRHVSGDGLRFKGLLVTDSPSAPHLFKPNAKFPTLEAYTRAVGQPGILLDREHIRMYAPKRLSRQARLVMRYLVRAYDELYSIVGVRTKYKIVVYHFPEGSENAWGGTGVCEIFYGFGNLELERQSEWKHHHVPHVSGYIEEMAHNFVDATGAQFGWEATGWSLGAKVSAVVAANPIHSRHVEDTRETQAETWRRYVAGGYRFPADLAPNLSDRIHAYILWQCEEKYGPRFWHDFFREVRAERVRLSEAEKISGADDSRNERYRITVECFDRLEGLDFKKRLKESHISTTRALKSLHPTEPSWNRTFE